MGRASACPFTEVYNFVWTLVHAGRRLEFVRISEVEKCIAMIHCMNTPQIRISTHSSIEDAVQEQLEMFLEGSLAQAPGYSRQSEEQ